MPNQFKVIISIAALALAIVVFFMDTRAGSDASGWVALLLGPLMVLAIWVFPEAKLRPIRDELAKRR